VTDLEIEAAYGPVHASYRPSRERFWVPAGLGLAAFVAGVAVVGFGTLFTIPGRRSSSQVGMYFAGGVFAVLVPAIVIRALFRARNDSIELRALGLVRCSLELGLKHCKYEDIARIEHARKGESTKWIDLFTRDGALIRVHGFRRDPNEMIEDLERRAKNAGGSVKRVVIDVR
jgi:hypothetical protein